MLLCRMFLSRLCDALTKEKAGGGAGDVVVTMLAVLYFLRSIPLHN